MESLKPTPSKFSAIASACRAACCQRGRGRSAPGWGTEVPMAHTGIDTELAHNSIGFWRSSRATRRRCRIAADAASTLRGSWSAEFEWLQVVDMADLYIGHVASLKGIRPGPILTVGQSLTLVQRLGQGIR